jgi:hypothetical protein
VAREASGGINTVVERFIGRDAVPAAAPSSAPPLAPLAAPIAVPPQAAKK